MANPPIPSPARGGGGLLQRLAQRRGTRPRAQRQRRQGQGAEDQQMRACTGSGSTRLDGTGAKHQRRHVERQDEQRQQHALASRAEGQCGGDA